MTISMVYSKLMLTVSESPRVDAIEAVRYPRNVPIPEQQPAKEKARTPRPIGRMKGMFEVPDSFFERLDDELVELFEGR